MHYRLHPERRSAGIVLESDTDNNSRIDIIEAISNLSVIAERPTRNVLKESCRAQGAGEMALPEMLAPL